MQNIEWLLNGVNDLLFVSSDRISKTEATHIQGENIKQENDIASYQALWRAVITQALMDAGNNFKNPENKNVKAHAVSWLSGYSDDFQQVCIMADMNPNYVKQKAVEAIKRGCKWRKEKNPFIKEKKASKNKAKLLRHC